MGINFVVSGSGPVFRVTYPEWVMRRYKYRITEDLGNIAVNRIKAYLPTQYKYLGHNGGTPERNPVPDNAGLYQSDIHTDRQSNDLNLVHDTPVVYGPWLEGIGSRNGPLRFPGYHAFRLISQQLNVEATGIANRTLQPYIAELNR